MFQPRKSVTVKEHAKARRFPIVKKDGTMSSSPVIILNPPATRDSYEYYYYEYDDDDDQEFGQSEKIERLTTSTEAATSEVIAAASEVTDQDASGIFFSSIFGKSDKCPYCDKGGYQKEPCCPHVVDGPWLFLLLGSIGLLSVFLGRQVAVACSHNPTLLNYFLRIFNGFCFLPPAFFGKLLCCVFQ